MFSHTSLKRLLCQTTATLLHHNTMYLRFENHDERIDLRVVSLPHHDIILGQPWLEKWNPNIDWKNHKINFTSAKLEQPLKVKKLEETVTIPERKTPSAAGYDLTPSENFTLQPGEQRLINTGIAMAIPEGYYGQLHPRSSAAKIELSVEGGVIDSDYQGPSRSSSEIKAKRNTSSRTATHQ